MTTVAWYAGLLAVAILYVLVEWNEKDCPVCHSTSICDDDCPLAGDDR